MNGTPLRFAVQTLVVLFFGVVACAGAWAQDAPSHFKGLINDFTPQSVTPGGPWEIRGTWSLELENFGHLANFSAAIDMVRSDYWVVLNPAAVNDDSALTGRNPHTHHITMTGATVTMNTSQCAGLEATGPANISANGASKFPGTTLTVCITGGPNVKYSNVTLTLSAPANTHFGSQPINGVVKRASNFE